MDSEKLGNIRVESRWITSDTREVKLSEKCVM
jgi:hypothetical protein